MIRGKLIILPISGRVFYIQPLYLEATGEPRIPQLKRVIVSDGERLAMEESLESGLEAVFGEEPRSSATIPRAERDATLEAARKALQEAESALRDADWPAFGSAMETLREALDR